MPIRLVDAAGKNCAYGRRKLKRAVKITRPNSGSAQRDADQGVAFFQQVAGGPASGDSSTGAVTTAATQHR